MSDTETKAEKEPESEQERLTDLEHGDELSRMVARLSGLQTALYGLDLENSEPSKSTVDGFFQLVDDVCENMKACAEAFSAERELRMAEGRR
jgi:hypothetical protein